MSDAPSYLPPYARATRGLPSPVTPATARAADDPDDDADDLDREEDEHPLPARQPSAPVREGLPPTYRMRHEAHYVEALVGSRTPVSDAPPAPAAPSAPIAAVPTAPPPPSEADTLPPQASAPVTTAAPIPTSAVVPAVTSDGAVLAGLTASLEAIAASLDDLSRHGRPLRERVALDLARAEVTRARWVTDAAAVLRADPLPALDAVDLAAVCRSVAEAFAPEFRLGGGAAVLSVPAGAAPVFGDERLLTDRGRRAAGCRAPSGRGQSRRRQPHHAHARPAGRQRDPHGRHRASRRAGARPGLRAVLRPRLGRTSRRSHRRGAVGRGRRGSPAPTAARWRSTARRRRLPLRAEPAGGGSG